MEIGKIVRVVDFEPIEDVDAIVDPLEDEEESPVEERVSVDSN